ATGRGRGPAAAVSLMVGTINPPSRSALRRGRPAFALSASARQARLRASARQAPAPMIRLMLVLTLVLAMCPRAAAQQPPARIGPFVVDLRATVPSFPSNVQLAASRGVGSTDLPGAGLGIDIGAHVYLARW